MSCSLIACLMPDLPVPFALPPLGEAKVILEGVARTPESTAS